MAQQQRTASSAADVCTIGLPLVADGAKAIDIGKRIGCGQCLALLWLARDGNDSGRRCGCDVVIGDGHRLLLGAILCSALAPCHACDVENDGLIGLVLRVLHGCHRSGSRGLTRGDGDGVRAQRVVGSAASSRARGA